MDNIEGLIDQLTIKNNVAACGAADALIRHSAASDEVYPYFTRIAGLLASRNSLVRNRALLLLAANAQWDEDGLFDEMIDRYLAHVTDEKPITARQCIKGLPEIAAQKPHLIGRIRRALESADVARYPDSMRSLVERDIRAALSAMQALSE